MRSVVGLNSDELGSIEAFNKRLVLLSLCPLNESSKECRGF